MGIHPQTLQRLVKSGKLERAARGLYRLPDPDYELTEENIKGHIPVPGRA